jgi:hypothetical protein
MGQRYLTDHDLQKEEIPGATKKEIYLSLLWSGAAFLLELSLWLSDLPFMS